METNPIGSRYAACVKKMISLFRARDAQNSIHLSGDSEPQPDLSPLKPREEFYAEYHPTPRMYY